MQYNLSENREYALHISKIFIAAKIQNYRNILRRFIRDNGANIEIERIAMKLDHCKHEVLRATTFDELRGVEGDAANDVSSALESIGLDPYVGFLHTLRPGRTSLALDVMEELRAYLGDRLVLS